MARYEVRGSLPPPPEVIAVVEADDSDGAVRLFELQHPGVTAFEAANKDTGWADRIYTRCQCGRICWGDDPADQWGTDGDDVHLCRPCLDSLRAEGAASGEPV